MRHPLDICLYYTTWFATSITFLIKPLSLAVTAVFLLHIYFDVLSPSSGYFSCWIIVLNALILFSEQHNYWGFIFMAILNCRSQLVDICCYCTQILTIKQEAIKSNGIICVQLQNSLKQQQNNVNMAATKQDWHTGGSGDRSTFRVSLCFISNSLNSIRTSRHSKLHCIYMYSECTSDSSICSSSSSSPHKPALGRAIQSFILHICWNPSQNSQTMQLRGPINQVKTRLSNTGALQKRLGAERHGILFEAKKI